MAAPEKIIPTALLMAVILGDAENCHSASLPTQVVWQGVKPSLTVQELHQIAQGLLSNLLRNLCSCQVSDTFASRAPTIEPGEPGSVAMELWLPERYATLDPAVEPPAWSNPSPEQVTGRTDGTFASLLPFHSDSIQGAADTHHSIRHRHGWQ